MSVADTPVVPPARHDSFVAYAGFRYLKAVVLLTPLIVLLAWRPIGSGFLLLGTPAMVWATGIVAFGLMLWLLFYGVRRRLYPTSAAPLRGWLSAHVYLGLLPLVLVPIHASFRFGANVHTLAFFLLAVVIASGIVGSVLYLLLPTHVARLVSDTYEERLAALAVIKTGWRASPARERLPHATVDIIDAALEETLVGNIRTRRHASAKPAIEALRSLPGSDDDVRQLIAGLGDWEQRMQRLARELRLRAWLHAWKVIHIPVAYAALVAVLVHVVIVVVYR